MVLEDRGNGLATARPAVAPTTLPRSDLFPLPLLLTYQQAFRNHFEGVTCKILRLSSSRYVILYLATYNQKCPLNCGKGPCNPNTYSQHLAREHPSALLLQCPTPGCGSSFFGVHQLFYHLLRAHDPASNPLTPFVDNRLQICPYGGCYQDTRYTTSRGGEHAPFQEPPTEYGLLRLRQGTLRRHQTSTPPLGILSRSRGPIPPGRTLPERHQDHHPNQGPIADPINSHVYSPGCP